MKIKLISLRSHHTSEIDGDEVFLKVNKQRIWPIARKFERMSYSVVDLNTYIEVSKPKDQITIEVWEYDSIFYSHCIGEFNLVADAKGGPYHCAMARRSKKIFAGYELRWEIN